MHYINIAAENDDVVNSIHELKSFSGFNQGSSIEGLLNVITVPSSNRIEGLGNFAAIFPQKRI